MVDDQPIQVSTLDQILDEKYELVAEAETTTSEDPEVKDSNQVAETLISLQNLIERNANELDRLREEQKQLKESLKNIFENDVELADAQHKAQEASRAIKERKQSVDNSPEVKKLTLKLSEMKEEMKEIEETLNNHLINLFQLTGTNSFDTSDGDQREFILRAKVKPKKSS